MRLALGFAVLFVFATACSSDAGGPDAAPDTTQPPADIAVDAPEVPTDVGSADLPPPPPDIESAPDAAQVDLGGGPEFYDVGDPPRRLAFQFTRPPVGEPVPDEDVTAFTRRVAAALHDTGYFRWLLRTSIGVDASTGHEDFLGWYRGADVVKEGDTVTFRQVSREHNMWIHSSKVLGAVIGAYLHTGDWEAAKLAEQYCKGLTASVKGFVWGEDDPAPWLMARAIFPMDQEFTLDGESWRDDGRKKNVVFTSAYEEDRSWNAETFAWPENPTWGAIWVTNMRSKDDVRAISRAVTFLYYVVEDAPDDWVREACAETLHTMEQFHKDIVDEDYFIRTKDDQGVAYRLPCGDQKDLGSYSCFTGLDPRNECCARLSADMIAYGERRTNACGTCTGSLFDHVASVAHFYNIPIVWDYHMAGLGLSLVKRQHADAYDAMRGLAERIDSYIHPVPDEPGIDDPRWNSSMAALLVEAAAMGLPLTAHEVRHVHRHWDQAAIEFRAFDMWDLWDDSVLDGTYGRNDWRPTHSDDGVPIHHFAQLFEYCASPFKNPDGESFVDCAVLADPSAWAADR